MSVKHNKLAMDITIIGCGVTGLTTGIVLLEKGYRVRIISDKMPAATTSAKAAAIWLPFKIKPQELANRWSRATYDRFLLLSENPASGISMITFTVGINQEEEAWWKAAMPQNAIQKTAQSDLPSQIPLGYHLKVPLIETPIYLAFLLNEFKKLGGQLSLQKVRDIKELALASSFVINCTGLAARELVGDNSLYPIQGQILKIPPQAIPTGWDADNLPNTLAHEIAYIIPRKDCIVLGGTVVKNEESLVPDPTVTKGILARCKTLAPQLFPLKREPEAIVGLRPGRPTVRLEKEGNIIHNYGHGGAGYTVSWACAEEVLAHVASTSVDESSLYRFN